MTLVVLRLVLNRVQWVEQVQRLEKRGLAALVLADEAGDVDLDRDGSGVLDAAVVLNTNVLEQHCSIPSSARASRLVRHAPA
jgi:hypothetical protein